jgi:hypothetical protein
MAWKAEDAADCMAYRMDAKMWKGFVGLRALVYLRKISRELARSNDIAEARLATDLPQQFRTYKSGNIGKRPKIAQISSPTVEEWNKKWKEQHPEPEEDEGA